MDDAQWVLLGQYANDIAISSLLLASLLKEEEEEGVWSSRETGDFI